MGIRSQWEQALRQLATPLSVSIFVIVGISGGLMFFDVGKSLIRDMHGWLGFIFLFAAGLHMLRNDRGLIYVIRQRSTHLLLLGAVGLAAAILLSPEDDEDRAFDRLVEVASRVPLSQIAPLVGTNGDVLLDRLRAGGVDAASVELSLKQIEAAQHVPLPRLVFLVLGKQR